MSKNGSKRLGANISVPFISTNEDGTTERNWARMGFAGPVDRRRIKREVRKWVKRQLGRRIDADTLRRLLRNTVYY